MPLENCHERNAKQWCKEITYLLGGYENKTRRRSVCATDKSGQFHRYALSIIMRFMQRTLYIGCI